MIKRVVALGGIAATALFLSACTVEFLPGEQTQAPTPPAAQRPAPVRNDTPRPSPVRPSDVPSFTQNEVLTYKCDGGRLLVKYTSNDSVEVFADGWQNLSRTTSRDGWFVYRDADHSWYARGDQGHLRRDGKDLMTGCRL